jgi:hypothetical protein
MPEIQMEFLNMSAEGENSPKKFKKYRAFIGIGVIAAAVGLSSTLAANININAGPVEFGQGVAQTVACSGDESIIVTPATSFTNAPSSVTKVATFYGGDSFTVASTADLAVGMILDISTNFGMDYVITEIINDLEVRVSYLVSFEETFPVTFTPSSGTEQTITPISTDNDPSGEPIGASSMVLPPTSIEIGMLVSGPGIPSNTTVVYVESGANLYIELSKDIDDRGQELTFTNSGKSSFKLSDITVSGIPDTCTNKVFTIKLYDNESAEPLRISSGDIGDSSAQVWWANGYQSGDRDATDENEAVIQFPALYAVWGSWETNAYNDGPAIETADTPMSTMADGAFKINLPMSLDASRVYKITVESQDDSDSLNVNNAGYGFYDWWWD